MQQKLESQLEARRRLLELGTTPNVQTLVAWYQELLLAAAEEPASSSVVADGLLVNSSSAAEPHGRTDGDEASAMQYVSGTFSAVASQSGSRTLRILAGSMSTKAKAPAVSDAGDGGGKLYAQLWPLSEQS